MSTSVRVLSYSLVGNTKLTQCRGALQIPVGSQLQGSKGFNCDYTFRRGTPFSCLAYRPRVRRNSRRSVYEGSNFTRFAPLRPATQVNGNSPLLRSGPIRIHPGCISRRQFNAWGASFGNHSGGKVARAASVSPLIEAGNRLSASPAVHGLGERLHRGVRRVSERRPR